jgi:xanthine dehydrogenase YagS FAD-binding subunit
MQSIHYQRARDADDALHLGQQDGARFIGGGTNLLDLMKGDVEHPLRLIDITRAGLDRIEELPGGGLRIGAGVRNAEAARHAAVRQLYPLLAQAMLSGASAQLRNMATMGGNLMQRTRCPYFTDTAFSRCNKRQPGSGCDALQGYQRMHAILGASPSCVAVNPSDMSVALVALDAAVLLRGAQGERRVPIGDFHRLPGDTPQLDTVLRPGELIVAIDLPPSRMARHSHYLKLRDRASYAFALVSVAAALEIDGGMVRQARIALGGVAHKPWRRPEAEAILQGRALDEAQCHAAAQRLLDGAQPLDGNRFKVELAQRAIVRALRIAGESA